jgi:hypothetical protein
VSHDLAVAFLATVVRFKAHPNELDLGDGSVEMMTIDIM